jgi:hypothetical protein
MTIELSRTLSRRAVLTASASGAAAAVLGLPSQRAAGAEAGLRFPGDPGAERLYYGASSQHSVDDWEQQMGVRLALHRTYYRSDQTGKLVHVAANDLALGRLPHVSIKAPGSWASVAAGAHDAWLRSLARRLGALDQPIFFTLHHEPEDNRDRLHGRSPADFVAMQAHAIRVFGANAPMVTVVPVLMGWSFSKHNRHVDPDDWFVPAARIYGVDVYNPFSARHPKWVSFAHKLDLIRPHARGRPIAIGEYGCRNDPADPHRAARWMRDAYTYARSHNIVSMSYFNSGRHSPDGSWALDGERQWVFRRRLTYPSTARLTST